MIKTAAKRALAVLLAATVLCMGIPLAGSAVSDELELTVVSDIHYVAGQKELPVNYPDSDLYFHANDSSTIMNDMTAVFPEFLKQAAENSSDCVLICGDMVQYSYPSQYNEFVRLLREFQVSCGKPVYVVSGNHDTLDDGLASADFKRIYADFGFNQALAVHESTASYVVDLGSEYRLIAIDTIGDEYTYSCSLNEELICWVEQQAAQAQKDGKKVIAAMHHCLLEHIAYHSKILSGYVCRDSTAVADRFARAGIQYIFTGHQHWNDIAQYTTDDGHTIYDVLTGALAAYPTAYRTVEFTNDGVSFKQHRISEIDTSLLCGNYTPEQRELMANDFYAYTYGMTVMGVYGYMIKYINMIEWNLTSRFPQDNSSAREAIHSALTLVKDFLKYPMYSDGSGNVCVESIAAQYGVQLPETDIKNLQELATVFISAVFAGDEYFKSNDIRFDLCMKSAYTCYKYIMSEMGKSTRQELLKALLDIVTANETAQSTDESLPRCALYLVAKDRSFASVVALLSPLIERFSIDTAPADNNVTLPAYGQYIKESESFSEKLSAFFVKIYEFLRRLFLAYTGEYFIAADKMPTV